MQYVFYNKKYYYGIVILYMQYVCTYVYIHTACVMKMVFSMYTHLVYTIYLSFSTIFTEETVFMKHTFSINTINIFSIQLCNETNLEKSVSELTSLADFLDSRRRISSRLLKSVPTPAVYSSRQS